MTSTTVAPASRFSNTRETGMRVPLNTQAPLTLPGMLSTAEHCDQSSDATQYSSRATLYGLWRQAFQQRRSIFRVCCRAATRQLVGELLRPPQEDCRLSVPRSANA